MGQWHSLLQGLSGPKKPASPADASHKRLFIELAMLAILVLCLPFIIWWIWGCINNLGRWKVTDNSKADRKHYIKTWHGFTEREKVDRRKQKRKEVREKVRSMFVWKTTRADYSWIFWDPDGSKKAEFYEERNSTWLRHLPRWMRSHGNGSLALMTGGNRDQLGDAEKGLMQSHPFHNSDEIRPSHPFDTNQLHQTARVSSWQVDGIERGTCTTRTGIAMNNFFNASSTAVSTIRRRRLPQGTSRVFAAESAETNRAVQSQLFTSGKGPEQEGPSASFYETCTFPESIASFGNVTLGGSVTPEERIASSANFIPGECITPEEHIADHEILIFCDDAALHETSTLHRNIKPAGNFHPVRCITPEENIPYHEVPSSGGDSAVQETSTPTSSIKPLGKFIPEGCTTPEENIPYHTILSSGGDSAVQGTSTLPGSIKPLGKFIAEECTTPEEHIAHPEVLLSGVDSALQRSSTPPGSIEPFGNVTPCDGAALQGISTLPGTIKPSGYATPGGYITLEEHVADHELSSGDEVALQGTSTLSRNINPPDDITPSESDDQQSSMLQSTPTTIFDIAPRLPALMNDVIRLSPYTELSPEAADQLEKQLKSALAKKRHLSNAAQRTEGTRESTNSEDTNSFTNLAAWKTRAAISLETSSRSSQSSFPSRFSLCGPLPRSRPRPTAHVGRILDELRTKRRDASRGQLLGARPANHWSILENPEAEEQDLPPSEALPVRSHHTTDSDARPRSIAEMIRKFRETSISYRREVSHSHRFTTDVASEVDAAHVEHPSPLKPLPSRTYGSIKISKLRDRIRETSLSYRRDPSHSRISTISEASEAEAVETRSPLKPAPSRMYGSLRISKLRNQIRAASATLRRPMAIRSRRTPTPAAVEAAVSEADSAEWELDFDPEACERQWELDRQEELLGRWRGRDSLSTRYRQMKERVLGRNGSGKMMDGGAGRKSSGRTFDEVAKRKGSGRTTLGR